MFPLHGNDQGQRRSPGAVRTVYQGLEKIAALCAQTLVLGCHGSDSVSRLRRVGQALIHLLTWRNRLAFAESFKEVRDWGRSNTPGCIR